MNICPWRETKDQLKHGKLSFQYSPITIVSPCTVPFCLNPSICCHSHLNAIFFDYQRQVTTLVFWSPFCSVSSNSTSEDTSEVIAREWYAARSWT